MHNLIFLTGFMGAGKSALGRLLAQKLNYKFYDLDNLIEHGEAHTISEIFDANGESFFRDLESKYLDRVLHLHDSIIALGGGTLHNKTVVEKIKQKGTLVFIKTPFNVIFERLKSDESRPLLCNSDGTIKSRRVLKNDLALLYKKRLPLYEMADISFIPDGEADKHANVQHLLSVLKNYE